MILFRKNSALPTHLSPWILGTALSVSLLSSACRPSTEANASIPAIPVDLETLQPDAVVDSSQFVGQLEAVQVVDIIPEIQGRVAEIRVEPGQQVEAGQALMVLEPDQTAADYDAALAAVDIAIDNRDTAVQQLEIARAELDTAASQLEIVTVNVERARALADEGAISQLNLDEALFEQESAENKLAVAGEQVTAAEIEVRKAENSIRQAQAQADASFVSVQSKIVTTPISGTVDNLLVKLGDFVSAGQSAVAKVAQTEALLLNLQVPANQSAQLQTGMAVELIDPTNQALLATGSITFVAPTADADDQTVLAKARFRNVDGKLRDGQNVQALLIWDEQPGLLIPTTAVLRGGGAAFVYVVADEPNEAGQPVVSLSPIEVGDVQGDRIQVLSGLETGDQIAVSNILKLSDGVPIEPDS